ncbi:MAG: hypothetical protein GF418_03025, partial [Chitinivibrionales bacterium]|nr:hypothetical protein [Chitinivibrionales bacterium]MBD3394575.1 hypothetical protein [Chitinivibrionales bacterium]
MKKSTYAVICCAAVTLCVYGQAPVLNRAPSGAINDFAGVLSPGTRDALERLATALHEKTGVALVVATTAGLEGDNIDDITNRLYERWGIGAKGTDEGVLVLVAVGDRAIRIEPGYGSEGYITDAKAHSIIRTVAAPHLGRGEWDDGISATMVALARLVAKEKNVSLENILSSGQRAMRPVTQREISPIGGILIFLFILFLLFTPMGRAMLPWILLFSLG